MRLLSFLFILFFPLVSLGLGDIRGLHISATGNNVYECSIKANIEGMRRALSLVADQIGVKNSNFSQVPYPELKNVFSISNTISETSFDEKYTADVNYAYDNLSINELILKYGSPAVQDQFFEYIIIPVFKQKNVISFLDTKTEWLATWMSSKDDCKKYRLLPIDPTKMSTSITTGNVYSLTYEEFLNKLNVKRFKNILIASCEYFTRDDGSMYFSVTTEELSPITKNITETKYDVANPDNAKKYFDMAIDRIINHYGQKIQYANDQNATDTAYESQRMVLKEDSSKKAGSVLDALLAQPQKGKKLTKIQMRADIFSKEGLESFKEKLSHVTEVVKYKINLDDDKHYMVELYTDKSLKDLAEGFYVNQLTFRVYNNEYVMFELETGI